MRVPLGPHRALHPRADAGRGGVLVADHVLLLARLRGRGEGPGPELGPAHPGPTAPGQTGLPAPGHGRLRGLQEGSGGLHSPGNSSIPPPSCSLGNSLQQRFLNSLTSVVSVAVRLSSISVK